MRTMPRKGVRKSGKRNVVRAAKAVVPAEPAPAKNDGARFGAVVDDAEREIERLEIAEGKSRAYLETVLNTMEGHLDALAGDHFHRRMLERKCKRIRMILGVTNTQCARRRRATQLFISDVARIQKEFARKRAAHTKEVHVNPLPVVGPAPPTQEERSSIEQMEKELQEEIEMGFGIVTGKARSDEIVVDTDTCPLCGSMMRYNTVRRNTVCSNTECSFWALHRDATYSAMRTGENVTFRWHSYSPTTRLEETLKWAQALEGVVVGPKTLHIIMQILHKNRILPHEITISMIRQICTELKNVKIENTVQIFCRLTGFAPRRIPLQLRKILIAMFNLKNPIFWQYSDRCNNGNYAWGVNKDLELLGLFEYCELFPMLACFEPLDELRKRECDALNWQWIRTVGNKKV